MAFSDLQQKAVAEYSVQAAHKTLAKIELFSHIFTELNGKVGESVAVPVYDLTASNDFVAGTNDYGTGTNEIGGKVITLNKHLVKSVAITDKELAFTGITWAKDTAIALTDRLARDVNTYVFGKVSGATLSAEIADYIGDTPDKVSVAGLVALADDNDIPYDRCILALAPEYFAKVLGLVDYSMVGTGDYITTGVIKGLFGFKAVVMTSALPEGVKGAIILDEAMGVASKYLAPMTSDAYPEAWAVTSDNGFTLGARRFMDLSKGYDIFAMDVLFGAELLQPNKVVKLVESSESSESSSLV